MARPTATAALQRFIDDELMRAPLLVDQVVEAALDHIRKGLAGMLPHDRAVAGDLLHKVLAHRQHIVDYYIRSLRDQVAADVARGGTAATQPKKALSLSLVDEEEVSVDVEISHAIEAIRSVAEYELRELQTFVSALVGDMDVARDHNPFRPETHARALWASAQALPLSRGYQLTFMRHASMALAQVLRKAFAGASSRIESQGIEPASHRTLILPAGSRGMHRPRSVEATFTPDLGRIRDSIPVRDTPAEPRMSIDEVLTQIDAALHRLSPETDAEKHGRLREQQNRQLVDNAPSAMDQQQIELLSRIFDAILTDTGTTGTGSRRFLPGRSSGAQRHPCSAESKLTIWITIAVMLSRPPRPFASAISVSTTRPGPERARRSCWRRRSSTMPVRPSEASRKTSPGFASPV